MSSHSNKDEHKLLARINGNDNPTWILNESTNLA